MIAFVMEQFRITMEEVLINETLSLDCENLWIEALDRFDVKGPLAKEIRKVAFINRFRFTHGKNTKRKENEKSTVFFFYFFS